MNYNKPGSGFAANSALSLSGPFAKSSGQVADLRRAQQWRYDAVHRVSIAVEIVELLLQLESSSEQRVNLLRAQDTAGWSALHYAARSGLLGYLHWIDMLGDSVRTIPVNLRTRSGVTMLQLAVWNGHVDSVKCLLTPWPDAANPWRSRLLVNRPIKAVDAQLTELDLALMKRFVECSRVLVRARCVAMCFRGYVCDQLLNRLVLMGDGVGVELLLRHVRGGLSGGAVGGTVFSCVCWFTCRTTA